MTPYTLYHANSPFIANVNHAHSKFLLEPNCARNRLSMPPSLQSHEDNMQSQLYEQSIPDVSLRDFSHVDFMINNHDPTSSTTSKEMTVRSSFSSFPKDIRNYVGKLFSEKVCCSHVHQIM
ncbi:hypothetical protein BDR03DRAFT_953465 [Suillus americanus]|nr:hypothetical protein BDR03DRAFT_953465 [Suillus americanus]